MRHAVHDCSRDLISLLLQVMLLFSDVYVCASRQLSFDMMESYNLNIMFARHDNCHLT